MFKIVLTLSHQFLTRLHYLTLVYAVSYESDRLLYVETFDWLFRNLSWFYVHDLTVLLVSDETEILLLLIWLMLNQPIDVCVVVFIFEEPTDDLQYNKDRKSVV